MRHRQNRSIWRLSLTFAGIVGFLGLMSASSDLQPAMAQGDAPDRLHHVIFIDNDD